MAKLGFELDMSDILTVDAAQIVYGDVSLWKDRWGTYSKPLLDYSDWNLQSDASIRNSDGTRCMVSFRDEEGKKRLANPSSISKDRYKWRGAELISPAFELEDLPRIKVEFEDYIERLVHKGAIFKKYLFSMLHVHVDVSDVPEEEIMLWVQQIYNVQDELDLLGNSWRKRYKVTPPELEKWKAVIPDRDRVCDLLIRTSEGEEKFWGHDETRRIVDISHVFREEKANTVEFRTFAGIPNWEYIEACLELSNWLVEQWKNKVPYIDYYLILREYTNKIKLLDNQYGEGQ